MKKIDKMIHKRHKKIEKIYTGNKLWQLNDALVCRKTTVYKNVMFDHINIDDNHWEIYQSEW